MSTSPASIKTSEGLESAIALRHRVANISASVTFKTNDAPPYSAVIRKDNLPVGKARGSDLDQLHLNIEEEIQKYLNEQNK